MGGETVHALRGIDLEIEKKEFVSITGPSGCGKSTLLGLLGLLDAPTHGTYWLGNRQVERLSDDERAHARNQEIGFVFQSFHLLPRFTALRNVEMPLIYSAAYTSRLTPAKRREKALVALERVGMSDRLKHLPNQLSGGQRQRVAIARALVNQPSLILADEPTGSLDSHTGKEILALLQKLNGEGVTILVVTHDPQIAASTQRTLTLFDGKISEDRHRAAI